MATREPTGSALLPGTVMVSVKVDATCERTFAALTDPVIVREWFGELSAPLVTGATAVLGFGDGDFFTIDEVTAAAPSTLRYRWRFLGFAPGDAISWEVRPAGAAAMVTVTDADPERDPKWNDMLRDGWRDFTRRLVDFLATGANTRYDWRRSFEGAVRVKGTLAEASMLLADPSLVAAWLPIDGLHEHARLRLGDGAHPDSVTIEGLRRRGAEAIELAITSPEWLSPTECSIELTPRPSSTMVSVTHSGWEGIHADPEVQRRQRHRFADMWVAALRRASDALSRPSALQR